MLLYFSISSIFSAAKVDVLKDSSAKEVSSSVKILDGALTLSRYINFEQYGRVAAISSDNKIAVCFKGNFISAIDMSTGNLIWKIEDTDFLLFKISKNNRFVLIIRDSPIQQIIDLKNGNLIYNFVCKEEPWWLCFSDDSRFLIKADFKNKKVCLTDLNTQQLLFCNIPDDTSKDSFCKIFITSDNKIITFSNPTKLENVYDLHKIVISDFQGKVIKVIPIKLKRTFARLCAISSDNKFAVVKDSCDIYVLNLVIGNMLIKVDGLNFSGVHSVDMSFDNKLLAVATGNDIAKLIDLNSGRVLHNIGHSDVSFVSISSDNRFVTTISHKDFVAKITDLKPPCVPNLNSSQIKLINWLYANTINKPSSPIVLDIEQTAIFFTLNENIQESLFGNYCLKMKGLKSTFSNAVRYPILLDAIQHDNSTQSKQHVLRLGTNNLIQKILRDSKNKEFFLKIYAQEKVEHSNGNYVFVHGREWKWNLLSDIYKQLWNITKNDVVKNYEFLRFGVPGKNRKGQDILFMNSAIFGNCNNEGSCTANYWHDNFDQSSSKDLIDASQVFKTFKLEEVYKKYAANLKELEELHKRCSKRGEILLVSVSKSMLKHVICTQSGGGVKQVKIGGKYAFIIGSRNTADPKTILDAIKDPKKKVEPFDNLEWGLVLGTFDAQGKYTVNPATNNPNNGISIYSFHDADEKQMHEYEKKRDEIFAKIRADIKGKQSPLLRSKL